MLQLSGFAKVENVVNHGRRVLRLVAGDTASDFRHDALLYRGGKVPPGFDWVIAFNSNRVEAERAANGRQLIVLPDQFNYLGYGDIIRFVSGRNAVRVLFRVSANANYFLLTEQCNHYCLMCSQPPKKIDDSWLAVELQEVIPLLPADTPFLGLSGGEPTLLGPAFFDILAAAKRCLPHTDIHILSNGRAFQDLDFATRYAEIKHNRLSIGIPLYSSDPEIHDYVVQAKGAFDGTVKGILNLKKLDQYVEIRVVVHQQTFMGLPDLADFIFRNLTFVDHVTFMGLEITGFTRANMDKLWIDPFEYQEELRSAVQYLSSARMNVSIYNHQLCLLSPSMHRFAKRSISDWKNEYIDECKRCSKRDECGGFVSSSNLARSSHIAALN
jgi:His-Xaa-Ser system radical SAM maturase HxsC